MHAVRHLLTRRHLATLVCAATLLLRLLVPAGYMPVAAPAGVFLAPCPDGGAMPRAMAAVHHGGNEHREAPPPGAEMPCAFTGLGLGTADLPAVELAAAAPPYELPALARLAYRPSPPPPVRWRPPLRAPPLFG